MSNNEIGSLECTLTTEKLGDTGSLCKPTTHKRCLLLLGRNEFREITLRVQLPNQTKSYRTDELRIFKRFAHEGKATIRIDKQKTQLLLSNCPPDKLLGFLALFVTKLSSQSKSTVTNRQRLLSQFKGEFNEISPLDEKDLMSVRNSRARTAANEDGSTPKGKTLKRKPRDCDKENLLNEVKFPSLSFHKIYNRH